MVLEGWTLQKLIAPHTILFYSQNWCLIGTTLSLIGELSSITGVDMDVLGGTEDPRSINVAKRISWASKRETTRVEDIAYCLMGLFEVNMPLLYGEGRKAFTRLQEEILKNSDDHSLFAWDMGGSGEPCDLFASSPASFSDGRHIVTIYGNPDITHYTMTNQGLRIELPWIENIYDDFYLAPLNCQDSRYSVGPYVIILQQVPADFGLRCQYMRIDKRGTLSLIKHLENMSHRTVSDSRDPLYITQSPRILKFQSEHLQIPVYCFQVRISPRSGYSVCGYLTRLPIGQYESNFRLTKSVGVVGGLLLTIDLLNY